MAWISVDAQNGPLEVLENVNAFENINARSTLRNPLRNTAVWPRRLLRTDVMRSERRSESPRYGTSAQPAYNIVSYTWGRFTSDSGQALQIQDVSWELPRIDASHFSDTEFHTVLENLSDPGFPDKITNERGGLFNTGQAEDQEARPLHHIWLDVACIDQGSSVESQRERLLEINNQGVIFGRAHTAYVWLSHQDADSLCAILTQLGQHAAFLRNCLQSLESYAKDSLGEGWLDSTTDILHRLLSDPWFNSLWTLQEAFLRQDALILCREAKPVALDRETRDFLDKYIQYRASRVSREDYDIHESATTGKFWTVSTLATILSLMHRLLLSTLLDESSQSSTIRHLKLERLFDIVRSSSLCYFETTNAFAMYHATKFRRPRLQFDLVYGCMQIFNVHLGNPKRLFGESESLEELNDELVMWLINRHGSNSQMFIHTESQASGKSWRFTLDSEVTDDFMPSMYRSNRMYMGFHAAYTHSWGLRFNGIAYNFSSLARRWEGRSQTDAMLSELEIRLFLDVPAVGPLISIALDANPHLIGVPSHLRGVRLRQGERAALVRWLIEHVATKDDLRVLLLGHFMDTLKQRESRPVFYCMGILVVQKYDQEHGGYWQRLGLCLWESNLLPLRNECQPGKWEYITGLYG